MIFDNVNEETVAYLRKRLLQVGEGGRILITTRSGHLVESLVHVKTDIVIDLESPDLVDARKQYLASIKFPVSDNVADADAHIENSDEIDALVQGLGCLPIAINFATAFARNSNHSPRAILGLQQGKGNPDVSAEGLGTKSRLTLVAFRLGNSLPIQGARSLAALYELIIKQMHDTQPRAYQLL